MYVFEFSRSIGLYRSKIAKKLVNTITVKCINAVAISFSRKIANSYQCNFCNQVLAFSLPFPKQIVV